MYASRTFQLACAATALVSSVNALGINCRGSSDCTVTGGSNELDGLVSAMQDAANSGSGNDFYNTNAQIACTGDGDAADGFADGAFCAFFQNGASGTLNDAIGHVNDLINHGCKVCGSDPTQSGNDVSTGELTVNFVGNPQCQNSDNGCVVSPS